MHHASVGGSAAPAAVYLLLDAHHAIEHDGTVATFHIEQAVGKPVYSCTAEDDKTSDLRCPP